MNRKGSDKEYDPYEKGWDIGFNDCIDHLTYHDIQSVSLATSMLRASLWAHK
jgi:hypothetical protein